MKLQEVFSGLGGVFIVFFVCVCFKAVKNPSDAALKPKKPPASKAKKPDKSIWDSDSDTGSKKPAPALKGTPKTQEY